MALTTREAAAAIVAHIDAVADITAYLAAGTTPPTPRSVVVHPTAGRPAGPLGYPDAQLVVEFQTTSIGATAEQALWTHDKVHAALRRAVVTWTGAATLPIWPIFGTQQPVRRDDDLATALYFVTCSWVAHAQAA